MTTLKINKYEETFSIKVGNLFHELLSKCFLDDFDLDREWAYLELLNEEKAGFNQRADLEFIMKYYDLVDVYDNYVGYYKTSKYYLFKVKE